MLLAACCQHRTHRLYVIVHKLSYSLRRTSPYHIELVSSCGQLWITHRYEAPTSPVVNGDTKGKMLPLLHEGSARLSFFVFNCPVERFLGKLHGKPMASPEASKPIKNQVRAILAVCNGTLNSKEDRCIGYE
jgi:hypothetical protein